MEDCQALIENLHAGDKITIFSWKDQQISPQEIPTPFGIIQTQVKVEDDSLKGDVLEILAVNFPYFAVLILSGKYAGKRFSLDARKCKVMKVNEKYAEALIHGKQDPKQEKSDTENIPTPLGFLESLGLCRMEDEQKKKKRRPKGKKKDDTSSGEKNTSEK